MKLDIDPTTGQGVLKNVNFLTRPSVIHGNGPSKLYLNAFANYLAGAFINNECPLCKEDNIEIKVGILSINCRNESDLSYLLSSGKCIPHCFDVCLCGETNAILRRVSRWHTVFKLSQE